MPNFKLKTYDDYNKKKKNIYWLNKFKNNVVVKKTIPFFVVHCIWGPMGGRSAPREGLPRKISV